MKIKYTLQAAQDLTSIAAYFEEHNPAMLPKIHSDIESKLELIKQYPDAGHLQQDLTIRKAVTRRYRYILHYRTLQKLHEIQILAIRHYRQSRKFDDN